MSTGRSGRWYHSTRFRIAAPATLIMAIVVALGSVFLVTSLEQHLISQVDQTLVSSASYVKRAVSSHAPLEPNAPKGLYGQVFSPGGRLLGSSTNLAHHGPLVRVQGVGPQGRLLTIDTPAYGKLRVYEVPLGPGRAPILVEAVSVAQDSAATSSLALRLIVVGPLLVLLIALLLWFVVGRAMRPVERLRRTAEDISASTLHERLASPGTGDELDDLVATLNSLLDRLAGAIERERRLVADASHEFRSPLASIRATVEAEIADSRTQRDSQIAVLRGVQRLEDLVDQLLVLDGCERPAAGQTIPVDLDELVLSEIERTALISDVAVDASGVSGGQVMGRELDFSRIVDNLTSNAIRHARSTVAFSVQEHGHHVELSVSDDGVGVPPEKRVQVFEPFCRLDEDRGRDGGGTGLGLTIVAELVARYGGDVSVEQDATLGGARFTVRIPSAGGNGFLRQEPATL